MEIDDIKKQIFNKKCEVRFIFNDETTGNFLYTLYMVCDPTEIPVYIIERAARSIKMSEDEKVIEANKESERSSLSRWITKIGKYFK